MYSLQSRDITCRDTQLKMVSLSSQVNTITNPRNRIIPKPPNPKKQLSNQDLTTTIQTKPQSTGITHMSVQSNPIQYNTISSNLI